MAPLLTLRTSNRLETLAESLAAVVQQPLRSPFEPELIVVQSQGMARWLKLQLAEQHGICGNCQFPFPRAFSYRVFGAVFPEVEKAPVYDGEVLVWRIMKALPRMVEQPGFEPLKIYLEGEPDDRKRFQLSGQIARVLDQYLVYRPDLVLEWETGGADHWQAHLWREISGPFRGQHPAALRARFLEELNRAGSETPALPERVSIFGISALPPFYLEMLAALSRRVPVHLFLLEPCQEFWGYIRSEAEQEIALKRAGRGASETEALHLEKGNRLLASLGQLGRDFLLLVQRVGDWQENDESLFADPGEGSLLTCVQSDVLRLRDRGRDGTPRTPLAAEDDSIQVHSCHSPVRELEVLYDHVLAWFEQDPALAPGDILVMIPEIESYAPLIHAVFGSPENETLRIPFSVADRSARTQSHLIETFLAILKLADSRLGASAVLGLLESAPLRRKFELKEGDLNQIRRWVEQVRIRWGRDQAQRVGLGLPAWNENTWHHGLQRLLLGYAMAGERDRLFDGILPFEELEGDAADLLGRFLDFTRQLFTTLQELGTRRPLAQWGVTLRRMLDGFFATDDSETAELQVLRGVLAGLGRCQAAAGFDEELGLGVILEQLTGALAEDPFGTGYLTGGITFCALKPMRSIPSKVICLLGMNDGAFPRTSAQLSFDLTAEQRRLGDRSSRDDDRYLFLETLISARDRLYISYVGQSIRDNSQAPPSVLVSELMDYIEQGFELAGQVQTRHRLQAFSPAYFNRGPLFSYSSANLLASQAAQPGGVAVPFFATPLPEPEPEWRRVTLQTLTEFLSHPAKFLAQKRLGMRLLPATGTLEEREPIHLEGLERYALEQELLEFKLEGLDLGAARAGVRSSGRLPAEIAGAAQYAQVCREVNTFYERLKAHIPEQFAPPMSMQTEVGPFAVAAHFSRITPKGLLFYRPARIKGADLVRAWVEHLLWNLAEREGNPAQSMVVGKDSIRTLRPVGNAKEFLEELLALYWAGLCRPLKFFPKTSFAFAQAEHKALTGTAGKTKKTPLAIAEENWRGDAYMAAGECEDDYFALFFRDEATLDEAFQEQARTVFFPLLRNSEEQA